MGVLVGVGMVLVLVGVVVGKRVGVGLWVGGELSAVSVW
jgi:hypothetical protein